MARRPHLLDRREGLNGHDLYPVPYTEEGLRHMVSRVKIIQDYLEQPLVLENPSTYLTFAASSMPEEEFIARLAVEADCALLLDVNNVYVTCRNHDLDPVAYLDAIPYEHVVQIHLAGHTDNGTHCIDTHDGRVIDAVWDLYARVHARAGGRATRSNGTPRSRSFPFYNKRLGRPPGSGMRRGRWPRERAVGPADARILDAGGRHDPSGAEAGVRSREARSLISEAARDLESVVLPSKSLSSAERLGIYAHMYYARLIEVMEASIRRRGRSSASMRSRPPAGASWRSFPRARGR